MKFWEIFTFELHYRGRKLSFWLFFPVTFVITFLFVTQAYPGFSRGGELILASTFLSAEFILFATIPVLIATAGFIGDAAIRELSSKLHPLIYTSPIGESTWLLGKFLAVLVFQLLVVLTVPIALIVANIAIANDTLGLEFVRVSIGSIVLLGLVNAFTCAVFVYSASVFFKQAVAGYMAAILFVCFSLVCAILVAEQWQLWSLASLLDPMAITHLLEISRSWTTDQLNYQRITSNNSFIANRIVWFSLDLLILIATVWVFRFTAYPGIQPVIRRQKCWDNGLSLNNEPLHYQQSHLVSERLLESTNTLSSRCLRFTQCSEIAWNTSASLILSKGGALLLLLAIGLVLSAPLSLQHMGVSIVPTAARVTELLSEPLSNPLDAFWLFAPLIIIVYTGEVIWKERNVRMSSLVDSSPIPDWVLPVGKLTGICFALIALQSVMMIAGLLIQFRFGYFGFDFGVYVLVFLILRLADYILFAILAFSIHTLVNNKQKGNTAMLVVYGFMIGAPAMGIEHHLLVFSTDPGWTYSDMVGIEPYLTPWLWFKLYWAMWSLLFCVLANLLFIRGAEHGVGSRFLLVRQRASKPLVTFGFVTTCLLIASGTYIFYNTNVLNNFQSTSQLAANQIRYEQFYSGFADTPLPEIVETALDIEMYPDQRAFDISGTYTLRNTNDGPVDSLIFSHRFGTELEELITSRNSQKTISDNELGFYQLVFDQPLLPGDTTQFKFHIRYNSEGFTNSSRPLHVSENASYFTNSMVLPVLGYQKDWELDDKFMRENHGLSFKDETPVLEDVVNQSPRNISSRGWFSAIVSTKNDQIGIAPGKLIQSWKEDDRAYFKYKSDAPISNDYAIYSSNYAVHKNNWNNVDIEVLHHPRHDWSVSNIAEGAKSTLEYFSTRFPPYRHGQLRFVEHPGAGMTLHAAPVNISYEEGFSLISPDIEAAEPNLVFAIAAHEVAHHWWGGQLVPADMEGAAMLTESLAWYSSLRVVEESLGSQQLLSLLNALQMTNLVPRSRTATPVIRMTDDPYLAYRKGPIALYALGHYIGQEKIESALNAVLQSKGELSNFAATTLDLLRELRSVTPSRYQGLVTDLFELNTYWDLQIQNLKLEEIESDIWSIDVGIDASKMTIDELGIEQESSFSDPVEIGIYSTSTGSVLRPIYLEQHDIKTGYQEINIVVKGIPGRAIIDPNHLLVELNTDNNEILIQAD